ncbi:MAG: DUF1492 domain-containing protein [Oscillospiraceae bacterium]|nr:DUF1492 domain-containing protein [Oscillospiraceae bacterium]
MEFAKELNEYYLLGQAIEKLENRIKYLDAQLYSSPRFEKVVITESSGKNIMEEKYINLLTKKEDLQRNMDELAERKERVENYIDNISDMLIKSIAEKRVFEKKHFRQIARELGGNNTEDSVKKMYYRHVLNVNEEK